MAAQKARARVLVLTSTYPRWSGDTVPAFVHELARRMTDEFEMHVLAPHAAGAQEQELLDGVQVHRFRYLPTQLETLAYGGGLLPGLKRRPWRAPLLLPFLAAEYLAMRGSLRKHGFSLIHAHWLIPHGFLAACGRPRGTALLSTSHGSDLFALDGSVFRPFKRYALRHADAVTVVSAALQQKAATLLADTGRLHVVPMGVDTARFQPPDPGSTRSGLLYVGRLVRDKGLHTLLSALCEGVLRDPHVRLTVIGGGPDADLYRERVAELRLGSRVDFIGPLPNHELAPFYQKARMLIFPSLLGARGQQEGMGLVPLEALACGCPVIASDLPAVSEAIRDRETGLLFTPGDVPALAKCIAAMLQDSEMAAQTATAGRELVLARYGWDRSAESYRDVYRRLIGQGDAAAPSGRGTG